MTRICPSCGADLPLQVVICEYCGVSTVPTALTASQQGAIFDLVHKANGNLQDRRKQVVQKMNTLTLVCLVLLLLLLTLGRAVIQFSWQSFLILLGSGGAAMFLAIRYMQAWQEAQACEQVFRKEILPHIENFLQENPMPRWQFDHLGRDSLPEDAPLRAFFPAGRDRGGNN
jgi:hypothetical protein